MQVVKRDGSIVAFDRSKIVSAIQKANNSVDEEDRIDQETIEEITQSIERRHKSRLLVEDIQDMVEKSSWPKRNMCWPRTTSSTAITVH